MIAAGTKALEASRNSTVREVMVAGLIASLKATVTFVPTATPVAPLAGDGDLDAADRGVVVGVLGRHALLHQRGDDHLFAALYRSCACSKLVRK